MTTDRNSEGAVAAYIERRAGMSGVDPDVIHAVHVGTDHALELRLSDLRALLANPPAAEVQALVERWRQRAFLLSDPSRQAQLREDADELAKLIPRGNTK